MNYLPDEKMLMESDNKEIILTTHRIRRFAGSRMTSIMLEEVDSIELLVYANLWILFIAVTSLVTGLLFAMIADNAAYALIGILLGAVFLIWYLFNRKQVVSINSNKANIMIETRGLPLEEVMQFVDKLEGAKSNRWEGHRV